MFSNILEAKEIEKSILIITLWLLFFSWVDANISRNTSEKTYKHQVRPYLMLESISNNWEIIVKNYWLNIWLNITHNLYYTKDNGAILAETQNNNIIWPNSIITVNNNMDNVELSEICIEYTDIENNPYHTIWIINNNKVRLSDIWEWDCQVWRKLFNKKYFRSSFN